MKLTVLTLLSTAAIVGLAWSHDPNADNTEKNTRDRDDQSQTATDQSNDPAGAHLLKGNVCYTEVARLGRR
jgi:hypothetical protein